jgi:hypothetical protein
VRFVPAHPSPGNPRSMGRMADTTASGVFQRAPQPERPPRGQSLQLHPSSQAGGLGCQRLAPANRFKDFSGSFPKIVLVIAVVAIKLVVTNAGSPREGLLRDRLFGGGVRLANSPGSQVTAGNSPVAWLLMLHRFV